MFPGLLLFSLAAAAPLSTTQEEEVLHEHNLYRCMHGAAAVTWNSTVATGASSFGDELGDTTSLFHASPSTYQQQPPTGENLAYESGSLKIADSVGRWYQEVEDCQSLPGCQFGIGGKATGHFTAMVWKGVQSIGCGLNPSGNILVCRYWSGNSLSLSTANMQGGYVTQVGVRQETEAQCQIRLQGTVSTKTQQGTVPLTSSVSDTAIVSVDVVEASPSLPGAGATKSDVTDPVVPDFLKAPKPAVSQPKPTVSQDPVPLELVDEGPWVCYQPGRYRLLALTVPDATTCKDTCKQQAACTRYAFKADQSCDTLQSNCFLYQQDESGNECRFGHNTCYQLHPKTAGSSSLLRTEQEGAMSRTSKPKRQVAIGSQGLATDTDDFPVPRDPQGSAS